MAGITQATVLPCCIHAARPHKTMADRSLTYFYYKQQTTATTTSSCSALAKLQKSYALKSSCNFHPKTEREGIWDSLDTPCHVPLVYSCDFSTDFSSYLASLLVISVCSCRNVLAIFSTDSFTLHITMKLYAE